MRHLSTSLFALGLSLTSAFAQGPVVSDLIPSQMNAAGFIHVKKVLEDYKVLFDGGPLAEQIEQFVAMGMPDPRKEELRYVALAKTVEGFDADDFSVFVTRDHGSSQENLGARVAQWIQAIGLGTIETKASHGLKMFHYKDGEGQNLARFADLDSRELYVSYDRSQKHPHTGAVVKTWAGENPSFTSKYGTQTGAKQYAAAFVEVTEKLRRQLEDSGQLSFLSLIQFGRLELIQKDTSVRLGLTGTCKDDFDAETVKRAFQRFFERWTQDMGDDPRWGPILKSVKFAREGAVTEVSVELPEDVVKDLIRDLIGGQI